MNGEEIYNQYTAKCGDAILHVGHDFFLRWYMVENKKWRFLEDGSTRKKAFEAAHAISHDGKPCGNNLEWNLDERTRAVVLGECPKCLNPALDSDLKTYRSCPDCGWRIDFTKEQIEWWENKLKAPRS